MLDFPRCSDCLPDQVGSVVLLHSHLSHPADLTSLTSAIKGWLASRSSLTLLLIENMHVKEEATSNDFIVKTEAEEKDIADCVEEMDPYDADADGDQLYQVTGNESERSVADDDINSTHVKGKGLLTKKRKRGRPPKKRSTDSDGDDDFDPKKKYKAKIKRVHSPKEVLQVSADVNLNKDVDIKGGVTKLKASKDLGRRVKLLPHLKPRTDDHGVKSWVCDYCGKTKPSLKLLKQHIKLFHWSEAELAAPRRPADKDRTCEFCKTVMHGQYQKYYKHTQECEAKVFFSVLYRLSLLLIKLFLQLTGVNKYVCPLCGKDFPACVTYAHHYRKCAGLVPKDQGKTSCCYDGCDYATWGRLNMENHVNRVHLNKPIRHDHMCNTCGKVQSC